VAHNAARHGRRVQDPAASLVTRFASCRGLLIDVDGTLLVHDRPVPGAAATLALLKERGYAIRVTTNTTRRPRAAIAEALRLAGLDVPPEEILAPPALARRRILDSGRHRALLLVPEATAEDFGSVVPDEEHPDWVVVGDLGAGFTWERLNRAAIALRGGARLLALHVNRMWHPGPGDPVLDAGPFVAALEYAAATRAEVVGKPEPAFFRLAVEAMGLSPDRTVVVGDDPETDVRGGAAAGCGVILVRTGKYRGAEGEPLPAGAARAIDSFADLPGVLFEGGHEPHRGSARA
jgi:phospholysine phosphohistidine inorganic pyrophosphate phosphatase